MKRQCIDHITLFEHLTGSLSKKDSALLEEHLAECDNCLEEFVVASKLFKDKTLIGEEPIPQQDARSFWERMLPAVKEFYEWVKETPGHFPSPAYAPVRGSRNASANDEDETIHFQKILGQLQTEMIARKAKGDNFSMEIRLTEKIPHPMRFNLQKEGVVICSRLMAEDMLFIEKLPFGNYSVTLTENSEIKGACHFEISEAGVKA